MRAGWLLLPLILLAPALAENQTYSIRLEYRSPLQVMKGLGVGDSEVERAPRNPAAEAQSDRIAVPTGIFSIAPNDEARTLNVSGTPEAIEQLRRIVRLLDVPAKQLRLEMHYFVPSPASLAKLPLPAVNGAQTLTLDKGAAQQLRADEKHDLATGEVECANNLVAQIFIPRSNLPPARGSVTPRVNGDQTITLNIAALDGDAAVSRRIQSGQWLLAVGASGKAWLIRASILPDASIK